MDVDPDAASVRMDWHGYAPDQVTIWADKLIEAAWKHGYRTVEFVHGAPDVVARGTPHYRDGGTVEGRGRIKEILRQRLYRRHWRRWVKDPREGEHLIGEGRMVIALLDNPRPQPGARWPVLPPPTF